MVGFFPHTVLFHPGHQHWLLLWKMNLSASVGKMLIMKRLNQENQCLLHNSSQIETDSGTGGQELWLGPMMVTEECIGEGEEEGESILGGKR